MLMMMTDDHAYPPESRGDEPESGGERARRPADLGGWRPANFAPGVPRPRADAPPRPADLTPLRAIMPGTRFTPRPSEAANPAALPAGSCKEGLAGLFSASPSVRRPAETGVRLETERLILRILRLEDFDDYFAVAAHPETWRFSERGPMTSDEAWTRLLRHGGHWTTLGWGPFAVEEKATGRFVGEAGLGDFHRGLGPDYDGVPEGAWTIAPWAQGRGYATEAMRAALAWIETLLGAPRTVCLIHARNTASLRVADKLGFKAFGERRYRGYDAMMFERRTAG
jgi:RimJ/RimL family protein N-acetyltransferase